MATNRALTQIWASLQRELAWQELGEFPTPVQPAGRGLCLWSSGGDAYIKRDDLSSPVYGGNKVRTLEVLFGHARASGKTQVWSTGAFGSNHALASALHSRRAGLAAGALLFPQPSSWAALENLRCTLCAAGTATPLAHWAMLPFGMRTVAQGRDAYVMPPGGATPIGALAYVSAAFELVQQVERQLLPMPKTIVVGVGSTCTTAGLLVGFRSAAQLGLIPGEPPLLVSVRVSPWPVTSRYNVLRLAVATARKLADLTKDQRLSSDVRQLGSRLRIEARFLGDGYGRPTESGRRAIERFRQHVPLELDTTYSAKSAAAFCESSDLAPPVLFWSTKSSARLPPLDPLRLARAPAPFRAWIRRAERELTDRDELPRGYVPL